MKKTSVYGSELAWIAHTPIAFSWGNITVVSKDFIFLYNIYDISFCQIIILYKHIIIIVTITVISIVIIILIIYLCIF